MMKQGSLQYFPSLSDVVKLASGKVWTVSVPVEEYHRAGERQGLQIIHAAEMDGMFRLRLLSAEKPFPDALPTEPTLEEGYMTWLKAH
jgi:hypothetical protein